MLKARESKETFIQNDKQVNCFSFLYEQFFSFSKLFKTMQNTYDNAHFIMVMWIDVL